MPVEQELGLGVELVVEVSGDRPVLHADDEHRHQSGDREDPKDDDRADASQSGHEIGRGAGLHVDWRRAVHDGRRAGGRDTSVPERSAYGCDTTEPSLWTLVQPPRVVGRGRLPITSGTLQGSDGHEDEWNPTRRTRRGARSIRVRCEEAVRMSAVDSEAGMSAASLGRTLRQFRDPILLFAVPVTFGLLLAFVAYGSSWPIGFDFRGTLWEPARALLDGNPIYPAPTRDAVVVGNPAVYPPLFILASVPLALVPATAAAWLWMGALVLIVVASMWVLGVRDWRCHVLAVTSPVVVHGLYFGNLTILLLLPLALAWRYRDRAWIAGTAIGVVVAGKLFVWPLVVWLLLTRRFRAAAWAVGSAVVLVLGAWALIGFEGLRDYPTLLRVVQDVYAVRSISLSTVAGVLGASTSVAVAVAEIAGLVCIGIAAWLVRRADGDRRAFSVIVAACILASPIVWPNYAALLFVPIAVTWPRLGPVWFFGYATWILGAVAPKPTALEVCCRPADVPEQAWGWSHSQPVIWYPAGVMLIVAGVAAALAVVVRRSPRFSEASSGGTSHFG